MIDYEFRAFSPKLIDQTIKRTNWLLSKNLLIKRNSIENHIKILKKNKIHKIFLCSLPFEKKKIVSLNYNFLINYKKTLKINKELILPIDLNKNSFNFSIKFILRNLKHVDGVEIMCNYANKTTPYNQIKMPNIISGLKKVIKEKRNIKIFFFPQSMIKKHQETLSLSFISNIIIELNKFNKFKNTFFILLSGGGFGYYLNNGKFSKIFKNVNLIFDTHLNTPFKAEELLKLLGKKRVKFGSDYPFIEKDDISNIYRKFKKIF